MADSRYNTLLIIEGESREKAFFTKLINLIKKDQNITIVPFCNDIYELYKHIEELGETTTVDVILHYCKIDDQTRAKLKATKFVNVYLVFDLDLQDGPGAARQEKLTQVAEMLNLFNDETGYYGKLLVNYPMMESYRHFDLSDPQTLKGKSIVADNKKLTQYKEIVGREGTNKNIGKYTKNDFCTITNAHLMQANLLVNGRFKKPDQNTYNNNLIEITNIHQQQSNLILKQHKMLVLNTSTFLYAEFYPNILKSQN